MLREHLKGKSKKKIQREKANRIGIDVSLLNQIENSRKIKQELSVNRIAELYFSLIAKDVDHVFFDQLFEQLSFVSKYGTCIWDENGIKASVDLENGWDYHFLFTVGKNKLSTTISFFDTTIENTFLKDKEGSYTMQMVKETKKCENMLEGLINKHYDTYQVKTKKELHCFDEKNNEFAVYQEAKEEEYALNRNTGEKIISNHKNNLNTKNGQYFFKAGNQMLLKHINEKQEEAYFSSNFVLIKNGRMVLPGLLRVKKLSELEFNEYMRTTKQNEKNKKLLKMMSK